MRIQVTLIAIASLALSALFHGLLLPARADNEQYSEYVDEKGGIRLPPDYQTSFLHLGSFTVSAKMSGPTTELHGVYARPQDVRAFLRDGKFPDGAVLVKDVFDVAHGKLTTGNAAWATKPKQWFVMVKDAKGRFPDNPLWGDGWGWALFGGDDPDEQIATNYRTDCRLCHLPAKRDDWLFLRGYPVLGAKREAR